MSASPPAAQFAVPSRGTIARFRVIGDLTLDLRYRDARVDASWLDLTSGEFTVLWRLAEAGHNYRVISARRDAACTMRLRDKLANAGLADLILVQGDGSVRLGAKVPMPLSRRVAS